jgi:hypothetical protein
MAPGSYLVISAGTSTGTDPELVRCLQAAYGGTAPVTGRTAGEIAAWFDGFSLPVLMERLEGRLMPGRPQMVRHVRERPPPSA